MKKAINLMIKISFVIYILALFVILFFGSRGRWDNFSILEYAAMQMNLVPFKTIALYVRAMMRETINPSIIGEFPVVYADGHLFAVLISENTFFSGFLALHDSSSFTGGAGTVIDQEGLF